MHDTKAKFLVGIVLLVTLVFTLLYTMLPPVIPTMVYKPGEDMPSDVGTGKVNQRPMLIAVYLLIAGPLIAWAFAIRERPYGVLRLDTPARLGSRLAGRIDTAISQRPSRDVQVMFKLTRDRPPGLPAQLLKRFTVEVAPSALEVAADGTITIPFSAQLPSASELQCGPADVVRLRINAKRLAGVECQVAV